MDAAQSNKNTNPVGLVKALLKKIKKDDAIPYAYQLAYSLLLAIFPFLIFLLSLVGFMNLDPNEIITQLQRVMPGEAYQLFEGVILEVTQNQNGALLSVSILTAIWSAAGGFKAFMSAMNKVHGLTEDRSFLVVTLNAVLLVILLAIGIAGSLLFMVFARPIIETAKAFVPVSLGPAQMILSFVLPVVFIFLLFWAFYTVVPARNVKLKYSFPGAVFAAIAFMAASFGFQFYVTTFANYSKFYGALGAVVILFFWMLLVSIIMVVGGAINSLLIARKGVRYPYWKSKKDKKVDQEAVRQVEEKYKQADSLPDQQ